MEPQDIELQDLPTVATNDIPPDSLIPIAFRESNLTPFELYKITLEQLQVKLTTLNVEEIYNAFEKDSEFTNILFELQNDLIVINYDETQLNNLINDVQNFVIPQLQEILLALTNQTTGSLYNMFQELTTIYNILDYLNKLALNSVKTIILSVPDRINDTIPYSNNGNYSATNDDYNFYLEGFYNLVYLNVFIDTQNNLEKTVPINIFKMQDIFVPLILSPENNISEVKISFRLHPNLKASLADILVARPITFYRSTGTGVNSILYTLNSINAPLAKGNNFSLSLFFNKEGYISHDWSISDEILSNQDIPRINNVLSQNLRYILKDNAINFAEDGFFFSSKISDPVNNNINIVVTNLLANIQNRLFVLDIDFANINDANINFSVSLGALTQTIALVNPKKRALFLLSLQQNGSLLNLTGLILLDGINNNSSTEISLANETQITANNVENLTIYQTITDFRDERTINLQITADSLKTLKIILNVETVKDYYKAYSFTVGTITKTLPLIWVGDQNKALNQIDKIEINFNLDKDFVSTNILNSHQLTNSITDFVIEQTKLIGNQLFSLNLYLPLGVLSNRSSLNDPFGSAEYTASNISLDIPQRENEYRFRGGLYAKTFDNTTSDCVVITQTIHLTDWNVQDGLKIEKTADEKAIYIFVDNVNKKYYCKFDMQLSRNYASDIDIVFLLNTPTAIIDDPNPNFTTTYGYQIAGHPEIFRKTILSSNPSNITIEFVLNVNAGVATEESYAEPIVNRFDSTQYWTILEIEAYVAQEIASIISGGTIDLSGYATVQNLNDAIALMVPLNQYNIDQNIVNNRLTTLENRATAVENDVAVLTADFAIVNNIINNIESEITIIDDTLVDLQTQINNIDGVSIEYVNQINFNNQARIVNPSNFYQIVYPIPSSAIVIEKDIPLSAIKNRYLGLLDDGLSIHNDTYIHLKINIIKDQTEWEKQFTFIQKGESGFPDITTRISNSMPIDPQGNYQVPTYVNFGSFAKRVNSADISFFTTFSFMSSESTLNDPYILFNNLTRRNTALFDTNEIINRVSSTYTPRFFMEQYAGYIENNNNSLSIENVIAETHLVSTNNIDEYNISSVSMNHSCKIPINLIFALNTRRIIYFEINNPYASQTNVVFSMYHEDANTVSMIQAKNYSYQLFALFSNENAVSVNNFTASSSPFMSSKSPYYNKSYNANSAFKAIKLLDMNYYEQPIVQFGYLGTPTLEFLTYAYNPLVSYDSNFIYDGRSLGFIYNNDGVFFKPQNVFTSDFTELFLPTSAAEYQKNYLATYAQNCIGDYELTFATNTISGNFPYQHLWQIVEYNWKGKYIVQDSDLFLGTDLYNGTINDVEQTGLYFSAYKNTATTSAVQPYDPANENRVFVLKCFENSRANFTIGAIPYISENFYNDVLNANSMKIGIACFNVSQGMGIQTKFIVQGSIDLIDFFNNMFLFRNSSIQTNLNDQINTFITNNPTRPFVEIVFEDILSAVESRFHKKNLTDTSTGGVCSQNITFNNPLFVFNVLTSLPSPTNINNT